MKVNHGSKIKNLMGFAMAKIKDNTVRQISWSGSAQAVTKVISCAEIMKRKVKDLHQITEIYTKHVEEYWEPKVEDLERLRVNKDYPAITILLSKDELDVSHPSYQAPGVTDTFWRKPGTSTKRQRKTSARRSANEEAVIPLEKRKKGNKSSGQHRQGKGDSAHSKQGNGQKKQADNQSQDKSHSKGQEQLQVKKNKGKGDSMQATQEKDQRQKDAQRLVKSGKLQGSGDASTG